MNEVEVLDNDNYIDELLTFDKQTLLSIFELWSTAMLEKILNKLEFKKTAYSKISKNKMTRLYKLIEGELYSRYIYATFAWGIYCLLYLIDD